MNLSKCLKYSEDVAGAAFKTFTVKTAGSDATVTC